MLESVTYVSGMTCYPFVRMGSAAHNHPMNLEWIGYAAATLTTASFLPQAIMTIRTRDTRGISRGMYVIFTLGVGFWLAYGIALESGPMIAANVVTLGLASTILAMKLRYG
jgi:MtN3 and saliva related transmembrane protein